ncbi:MAG: gamma-glutamyltransferase [Alphaproteobacteria bacterium]|nr:gamma-glutamyltransferase [Alphaproteobacteria bacterium]
MKFTRVLALLVLASLPVAAQPKSDFAAHEMVAAANPLAAAAGLEMLKAHGSAVDAASATQLVLNLVEPESSGIGGGAFMLVYDPKAKKTTSFDGREVAPASATPGMFLDENGQPRAHFDPIPGGLSVGIPGVIGMLELAHKKYGKLPWAQLFQPAIRIAENGFPIGPKLARTIAGAERMKNMPDIARTFFHADGTPMKEGEILKYPELAATFRAIAQGGAKAFYTGPIAQAIVDAVQHAPGKNRGGMTLADLSGFQARELEPVCGDYRIYHLCSMGPPSSGGVAIVQILEMLQRFPSSDLKPNSLLETHLFTQASRLAYADRAKYLGDASVVAVPVTGLLDKTYIAGRAALIDPAKDMGTAQAGNPPEKHAQYAPQVSPENYGTSHMTIVDETGQVIAMTTSVETTFGAEIMAKGFILNNTLTDFSFQPMRDGQPVANAPAPGKRPLSAMSPTIVFDRNGKFVLGIGSPGGPSIIEYVTQSLVAILDGGLSPQEAIGLPRHLNTNSGTTLEPSPWANQIAPQLTAMGHSVRTAGGEGSGLHAIQKVPGGYLGGADPRRDGVVIGQ